ncbi:hypothetical protein SAY86_005664 [Trapa natans]|uniref:RRM domain-containing protein n=1 Tax=Trapa natans TaxID=22666 RepID=A0AAN7L9B5_TRANT|nr:hypothetical protein SAY86_005664 [Trapa natans]
MPALPMSVTTSPPSAPSYISTKLPSSISFSLHFLSSTLRQAPHRSNFLSLKSHPTIASSLGLLCLPKKRFFSSAYDGFEAEGDISEGSDQEDPETHKDLSEEGEGPEEGRKFSRSGEYGRLYIGNLPYSMTSSQLADIFQEAGRVVNVEVVYDRVTDRSRGFAFITMGSINEANEAIRLFDGSQIGGRTVKVNFPEVPRGGERELMGPKIRDSNRGFVDSPHKIYAGNLGWGMTSQDLRDAFADQPGLLSAKVIYDRNSGRSRGFGFISFNSAETVESALNAMNGVEVEGRPLRLNLAAERASSPPAVGNVESSFQSPNSSTSFNL